MSEEMERPVKKITSKLVKVMEEVSHVQKNGTNEFHKYQYATAADVLEKVNEALCKNKICSVAKASLISLDHVTNAKGNQEHLATVEMNIRLIDSESGEYLDIAGLGNGQDSGDKAVIESLMDKIRDEAQWAMEECTTDKQREKVYEEVKSSIQKLQTALERSGDKIITDLKAQTKEDEDDELGESDPLVRYRSTLEKLLNELENSKSAGESENVIRMELPDGTTRTAVRPSCF